MKMRLVVEVPLPVPPGDDPGDFYPNLKSDTQDIERTLPRTVVVVSSEYVAEVEDTKAIFKKFLRFKLEGAPPRGFKSSEGYSKGDEDAPFYSEAYLYNLLGKDDARTVLAYLNSLMTTCGLDPYQVQRELYAEMAAEKAIEQSRLERVAKRKAFKEKFIREKGWVKTKDTFTGLTEAQDLELRKACTEAGV